MQAASPGIGRRSIFGVGAASLLDEPGPLDLDGLRHRAPEATPTGIHARVALAVHAGISGHTAYARDECAWAVRSAGQLMARDHYVYLWARYEAAYWLGVAGDTAWERVWGRPERARDLFAALIPDLARVYGPHHPNTLEAAHQAAFWSAQAIERGGALARFDTVVKDKTEALGADHPDTLLSRFELAQWTGRFRSAGAARDLHLDLVGDCTRLLGPKSILTLKSRHAHAYWLTGPRPDPGVARDRARSLYEALVLDRSRVLGADHPRTLSSRHQCALTAPDRDVSYGELEAVFGARCRVLGRVHPDTVRSWKRMEEIRPTQDHEWSEDVDWHNDSLDAFPTRPAPRSSSGRHWLHDAARVAAFAGSAAVSGVIGNAAYDLLRRRHSRAHPSHPDVTFSDEEILQWGWWAIEERRGAALARREPGEWVVSLDVSMQTAEVRYAGPEPHQVAVSLDLTGDLPRAAGFVISGGALRRVAPQAPGSTSSRANATYWPNPDRVLEDYRLAQAAGDEVRRARQAALHAPLSET